MKPQRRRLVVLVTRPRGEAELFAVALAMRGHEAIVAPMIEIVLLDGASVDLAGAQAVLFTSANGVRAFAHAEKRRDLPAFCVGNATAAAARNAGFTRVWSAAGDVAALAALVRRQLRPGDGALVHAAGTDIAGDLSGELGKTGFAVRRVQLYRAEPADELPEEVRAELSAGRVDVATFFSPRTAQTFARLIQAAELEATLGTVAAVALAPATLTLLRGEGLAFGREETAARPDENALLDALDRIADEPAAPAAPAAPPPPPKFELPPGTPRPERAAAAAPVRRAGALVPLAVALVVAALGVLGWAYWQSTMTGGAEPGQRALDQRLAAVERRLSQPAPARVDLSPLETRLAALEGRPAAEAPAAPDADALAARLAALETRPAADPGALAALTVENRRLSDELARVQAELGRLQGGLAERAGDRTDARRAELRFALAQLRDALAGGRAFADELALARELAGEAAGDVAALASVAREGVETRASLARRFPAIANAAVAAARVAATPGLAGEFVARIQGFLSIRRVGDLPGDDPAARMARAEARLAEDDLAGALGALEGIQGQAWAAPALPWIETARRRLAAEHALAALTRAAAATGG